MRDKIKNFTPKFLLSTYRKVRFTYNKIKFKGNNFYCNVCNSYLRLFKYYGPRDHLNFTCPVCNSFGRHRMMALILEKNLNSVTNIKKILHFAPELGLRNWLKKKFPQFIYRSSNLDGYDSDLSLDLMNISLQSNSEHYVILSHVLEHVKDDISALKEIKRILVPQGKLFLQVPLSKNQKTIRKYLNSKKDRFINYGQADHVRLFGKEDLIQQLTNIGFNVAFHEAKDKKFKKEFQSMALDIQKNSKMIYDTESTVFVCQKPTL